MGIVTYLSGLVPGGHKNRGDHHLTAIIVTAEIPVIRFDPGSPDLSPGVRSLEAMARLRNLTTDDGFYRMEPLPARLPGGNVWAGMDFKFAGHRRILWAFNFSAQSVREGRALSKPSLDALASIYYADVIITFDPSSKHTESGLNAWSFVSIFTEDGRRKTVSIQKQIMTIEECQRLSQPQAINVRVGAAPKIANFLGEEVRRAYYDLLDTWKVRDYRSALKLVTEE